MRAAEIICENITMDDVIEKYGYTLNSHGKMCCPFHDEKTPSFSVYREGKRWKCFGCQSGGSVIDFVMKLFNIGFLQAVARIGCDFGISIGTHDDWRTRQISALQAAKRKKDKELADIKKQAIIDQYFNAVENYRVMCIMRDEFRKYNTPEKMSENYLYAIRQMPLVEIEYTAAEMELINSGY